MEKINSLIDVGTEPVSGNPAEDCLSTFAGDTLDSLNKRIKFLDEVVDNLGLTGIETVHGRAEDAGEKAEYREQFDLSVSRAVANLASPYRVFAVCKKSAENLFPINLFQWMKKSLRVRRQFMCLGGEIGKVEKFHLPGSDMERALVVVEKKRSTPKKYPRKSRDADERASCVNVQKECNNVKTYVRMI